jgi:hypothetical protein
MKRVAKLTPHGETFLPHAVRILEEVEAAKREPVDAQMLTGRIGQREPRDVTAPMDRSIAHCAHLTQVVRSSPSGPLNRAASEFVKTVSTRFSKT